MPKPFLIYCNNLGAQCVAKTGLDGERSKHIDLRLSFLKDVVEQRKLTFNCVTSNENPADIFTKPLSAIKTTQLVKMLGLKNYG